MYYSLKTNNKSFINMWRYLQRNNVENNLFMLETLDKGLMDFSIKEFLSMDREDPDFLSYRKRVIEEAKHNIWFYFRELVMVPDEYSINGYKQFELTPESMAMIYLYQKEKSFINWSNKDPENLCLNFLCNLHKSLYEMDFILFNNEEKIHEILNTTKKHLSKMEIMIWFGSSQIMSNNEDHLVNCNLTTLRNHPTLIFDSDGIYKYIDSLIVDNSYSRTAWLDDKMAVFILEDTLSPVIYSSILSNPYYKKYLNGPSETNYSGNIVLYNMLKMLYPKVDTSIYDKKDIELPDLYLI